MTGYQRPVREMEVVFESGDLAGLELTLLQNPDMRTYYDMLGMLFAASDDEDDEKPTNVLENATKAMERARLFAERCLLRWNLERDGEPVPPTPDEFTAHLEASQVLLVMLKWITNVGRVAAPLAPESESGNTSEEPKESPSPSSSQEPKPLTPSDGDTASSPPASSKRTPTSS